VDRSNSINACVRNMTSDCNYGIGNYYRIFTVAYICALLGLLTILPLNWGRTSPLHRTIDIGCDTSGSR